MSPQDKKKRERAMKMASAIGSIEGVPVSDKTKQLYPKWVNGEMDKDQLMKELYQRHRKTALYQGILGSLKSFVQIVSSIIDNFSWKLTAKKKNRKLIAVSVLLILIVAMAVQFYFMGKYQGWF